MVYKMFITLLVIYYLLNSSATLNTNPSNNNECDYLWFINGCDERSHCIDGHCLEISSIGEECITWVQCRQSDNNSACFASDDNYNLWICECQQHFYFDLNFTKKCLNQLSFGQKCNSNEQCLGDNSVCSNYSQCDCEQHYIYDNTLKSCKHVNNNGCDADREWNKFTKRCELKIHYSHRGGIN